MLGRLALTLLIAAFVSQTDARPRPPARRHQTLISSVSESSITIQEDHGPRTFAITKWTEVNVDGQRATVADLRPGMRVSVDLDDPTRVHRINAWRTR